MSLVSKLIPINFLEEKEKFWLDNTYNPQFLYEAELETIQLEKYGAPNQTYLSLAQAILDQTYFGRNEQDLFMLEGPTLDQEDVTEKVTSFLKMHDLEDRYDIVWSSSFISRATITTDTLKLRLPADFRKEGLLGMLYHEIGTHALRRINYEQQPWYKKKKQYGFADYLKTEEGLAALHGLLPHSFKSAYISAIRYLAVEHAQSHSFAELWAYLKTYIQDPERRWNVVFRQKRGLSDTAQPGGFTKDLVYFEGMVQVWQWLSKRQFASADLYYGKMAYTDIEKAKQFNPNYQPHLPSFLVLNPEKYQQEMVDIGKCNYFDQLK